MLAASGEARADAGVIHRRTDEGFAQAVAVGGVVAGVALLVGVAHSGIGLTAVGEARGRDVAGADHLAVHDLLLVHHVEFIARADVLGEVDVVAMTRAMSMVMLWDRPARLAEADSELLITPWA